MGVIISITPMGINRDDVKLQDPVTGQIHSVTVEADVVRRSRAPRAIRADESYNTTNLIQARLRSLQHRC